MNERELMVDCLRLLNFSMINQELQCPHCQAASSVETVLDCSRVSWPNQRWLEVF